jgi:hypothetical protein
MLFFRVTFKPESGPLAPAKSDFLKRTRKGGQGQAKNLVEPARGDRESPKGIVSSTVPAVLVARALEVLFESWKTIKDIGVQPH